jgi:hypothetical protein
LARLRRANNSKFFLGILLTPQSLNTFLNHQTQMKCLLCDSTETQYRGVTVNGDRKYSCLACKSFFTDPTVANPNGRQTKKFRSPEINFLYTTIDLNILNSRDDHKKKVWFSVISFFKSIIDFIFVIPFDWKSKKFHQWGILGFVVALCIYSFMSIWLKIDINQPSVYDSYTLQALAWRSGHLNLSQNYSWLEIATYKGQYFLSFPPVPTIPMLFLSFFFGAKTPSTWLMVLCFFTSYVIAYKLLRRFQNSNFYSALWAAFLICGSSYLDISLFGWVWYMAQSMSFVLTLVCILCLTYTSRKIQGVGLFAFALAVGCRPLQAIYIPLILGFIYQKNRQQTILKTIKAIIPMLIAPSLVAIALGTLNFLRFDSIFEFGHNYLPVLLAEPQFSLSYVPINFLRLTTVFPTINTSGQLDLPRFGGFAFYIANPIFIIFGLRLITHWKRNKIDWLLLGTVILHFFVLTMHITFGAWQFGTRFLVDMLPAVLVLCTRTRQPLKFYEVAIMLFGVAFNMYGSIVFRTS